MSPPHTKVLGILVLVIAGVAFVKTADILLGLATNVISRVPVEWLKEPRYINLRELPPNLTTKFRPSPEDLSRADGLDPNREYSLRTDTDGFIFTDASSQGPVDIVFIGGSTTECKYVNETLRFPALVGALLTREQGARVHTKNAGVSGNNIIHSLLNIVAKVIRHRPKRVVIMENINDLSLLMHTGSYWKAPAGRAIIQTKEEDKRSVQARIKDLLFPNIWLLIRRALPSSLLKPPRDEFTGFRALAVSKDQIKDDFRSSLLAIVSLLRAWKIEPVLMTQFNRVVEEDGFVKEQFEKNVVPWTWLEFVNHYKEFNDITRAVAAETKTRLIDLDAAVPHSKTHMYDAVHLNETGSKLVAQIVASEFARFFSEYQLAFPSKE